MVKQNQKKTKSKRLEKKWFASASGWGLSLELGSGDTAKGKVKRSIGLPADSKVNDVGFSVGSLTHNNIYLHNIMAPITQGTTANNRLGDSVNVKSIVANFVFDNASAVVLTNGFLFRLMIVAVSAQNANVNWTTSGGAGTGIFYSSTGGNIVAVPDQRVCKVICDEVHTIQPNVTACLEYASISCTLNAPFEYQTGTSFGTAANLYLLGIPYVTAGNPGVTVVCNAVSQVVVSFTD